MCCVCDFINAGCVSWSQGGERGGKEIINTLRKKIRHLGYIWFFLFFHMLFTLFWNSDAFCEILRTGISSACLNNRNNGSVIDCSWELPPSQWAAPSWQIPQARYRSLVESDSVRRLDILHATHCNQNLPGFISQILLD